MSTVQMKCSLTYGGCYAVPHTFHSHQQKHPFLASALIPAHTPSREIGSRGNLKPENR